MEANRREGAAEGRVGTLLLPQATFPVPPALPEATIHTLLLECKVLSDISFPSTWHRLACSNPAGDTHLMNGKNTKEMRLWY